jgi:hypothetical protein
MINSVRSRSWPRRVLAAVTVVAALAACAWAADEVVTVQRNRVDVLKGKGSMYLPPLATAHKQDTLKVLDHEGRWLKVDYNGVQGYVLAASLTSPDVGTTAAPGSTAGGSTEATAAAAAKGWNSNTWADSHSYNLTGIQTMIATRDRLKSDPDRFAKFKTDGSVGAR